MEDIRQVLPVCRRCGYRFDPKHPERQVMIMQGGDGHIYAGCSRCAEDLEHAFTDEEKRAILAATMVKPM